MLAYLILASISQALAGLERMEYLYTKILRYEGPFGRDQKYILCMVYLLLLLFSRRLEFYLEMTLTEHLLGSGNFEKILA